MDPFFHFVVPGVPVFGEGLPNVRIDLGALHVSFADVFEPQLWSANATGTVSELAIQNFSHFVTFLLSKQQGTCDFS